MAHREIIAKGARKGGIRLADQRDVAARDAGLSDCRGHGSCFIGSDHFLRLVCWEYRAAATKRKVGGGKPQRGSQTLGAP